MNNKYQDKFGYPIERTKGKVRPFMAAGFRTSSGTRRSA